MRRYGIGGSDAGVIAGVSKYKTPYELWMEKTGQIPAFNGNEATIWGNALEDAVAEQYSKTTGHKLRKSNSLLNHPKHTWMTGNLDRLIVGEKKILEIKTALGKHRSDIEWGENGTDIVPESYFLQVQHYMAVTGFHSADIAALVSGNAGAELRIYPIERNEAIINRLIEIESEFWNQVEKMIPPSISTAADAFRKWSQDNKRSLIATDEIWSVAMELKDLKSEQKKLDEKEEKLELKIFEFLGENAFLTDKTGNKIASWQTQERNIINTKLLREEMPDIADKYNKKSTTRVFRIN